MPFSRGDYGDEKPSFPPSVRKTATGRTQKRGNTSTAANNRSRAQVNRNKENAPNPPRKPMRETSTDQPLRAPQRPAPEDDALHKRQADPAPEQGPPRVPKKRPAINKNISRTTSTRIRRVEARQKKQKQREEAAMCSEPTESTDSEDSDEKQRERVIASTVLKDDSSYNQADQKIKVNNSTTRRGQNKGKAKKVTAANKGASTEKGDKEHKASLRREQQEQAEILAAKNASTRIGDKPDEFGDKAGSDELSNSSSSTCSSTPGPTSPPTRQSNTALVIQPGAYQGNPGEGFRRNSSNWKQPFRATRTTSSDQAEVPTSNITAPATSTGARMSSPRNATASALGSPTRDDEALAKASPVTDEENPPDPSKLELARPNEEYQREKRRRRLIWFIGVLIIFFVLVMVGLGVWLLLHYLDKDSPAEFVYGTRAPSPQPTLAPTPDATLPFLEGLSQETLEIIQQQPASPQARAYQWFGSGPYRNNYDPYRARQRFALATIYYATKGPLWTNATNWLEYESNECKWFSSSETETLDCDADSAVIGLRLDNNTLGGALPPEIGLLTMLQTLDVAENQIQGSLPSQLGLLTNLHTLRVNDNFMAGSLPFELTQLSKMETVLIHDNNIGGQLPTEIGQLTLMKDWHMARTKIGGPIPTELGKWAKLTKFRTWNTDLTGTLPTQMGLWTDLNYLAMHNGMLRGTIPTEFGRLTALTYMQLDVHSLTGAIPSELGQLEEIAFLSFGANRLASTIPSELGQLPKLQGLRFYQNQLTGSLPTTLGDLPFLQKLELDDNQLNGRIPSALSRATFLAQLFLANNQLSGDLPPQLGFLKYLQEVTLMNNARLGGSIPVAWGNLASQQLEELFLNGADITGSIPSALCTIDRLVVDCNEGICGCSCQACG